MRAFEIYDASRRNRRPLAVLLCGDADGVGDAADMSIVIDPEVSPDDLPLMLALFARRGQREVPSAWARRWVAERIPPEGRQNLGEILRAHGLSAYDEVELLAAAQGRSSQDDFLVREVSPTSVSYAFVSLDADGDVAQERDGQAPPGWRAVVGRQLAERRKRAGMTQQDLAEKTGIDQAAISRIESGKASPAIDTLEALASGVGAHLDIRIV